MGEEPGTPEAAAAVQLAEALSEQQRSTLLQRAIASHSDIAREARLMLLTRLRNEIGDLSARTGRPLQSGPEPGSRGAGAGGSGGDGPNRDPASYTSLPGPALELVAQHVLWALGSGPAVPAAHSRTTQLAALQMQDGDSSPWGGPAAPVLPPVGATLRWVRTLRRVCRGWRAHIDCANSVVALDMGPLRSPSGAVREPCRPPSIFPRGSADWNLPVRRVCTV
jgi:hypothetical protein